MPEIKCYDIDAQVTSLPPPWGTCVKGAVSYQTCGSECRDLKVANMCGCRDVYMSELDEGIHLIIIISLFRSQRLYNTNVFVVNVTAVAMPVYVENRIERREEKSRPP